MTGKLLEYQNYLKGKLFISGGDILAEFSLVAHVMVSHCT